MEKQCLKMKSQKLGFFFLLFEKNIKTFFLGVFHPRYLIQRKLTTFQVFNPSLVQPCAIQKSPYIENSFTSCQEKVKKRLERTSTINKTQRRAK